MNTLPLRLAALSLILLPVAFIAQAKTRTPAPGPTRAPIRTPKPTRAPRPTRTPRPTSTPRPTPTPTRLPIPVSATDGDNGKTLFVARGGVIELRLESNPSTGYAWHVVSHTNLQPEGEPTYEATPVAAGTVGSGGFAVYHFRAVRAGRGSLALDLRSPAFKAGDKPAQTFRATVQVLK